MLSLTFWEVAGEKINEPIGRCYHSLHFPFRALYNSFSTIFTDICTQLSHGSWVHLLVKTVDIFWLVGRDLSSRTIRLLVCFADPCLPVMCLFVFHLPVRITCLYFTYPYVSHETDWPNFALFHVSKIQVRISTRKPAILGKDSLPLSSVSPGSFRNCTSSKVTTDCFHIFSSPSVTDYYNTRSYTVSYWRRR